MKEIKFPENTKLHSLMKRLGEGIAVKVVEIPEEVKVKFITINISQKEFTENIKALFEKLKIIPEKIMEGLTILARIIARVESQKENQNHK